MVLEGIWYHVLNERILIKSKHNSKYMQTKTTEELIEYFLHEKRKGMGFSEIRKSLVENHVDEDEIKFIINTIDDQILIEERLKSQNNKAKELIYIGPFITIAGLILTLGTLTGVIYMGD